MDWVGHAKVVSQSICRFIFQSPKGYRAATAHLIVCEGNRYVFAVINKLNTGKTAATANYN